MIFFTLPPTRKPTWVAPAPALTGPRKFLTQYEINRRDDIIRKQLQECNVKYGEIARPVQESGFNKYGVCRVQHINQNWNSYRMDYGAGKAEVDIEWKNDMPFIVHAQSLRNPNEVFTCTYNYLRPLTPEELKEYEELIGNSNVQQHSAS